MDITCLKVRHEGTERAKALRHYISKSDVYGLEIALSTDEDVTRCEKNLEDAIKQNTRTSFIKLMDKQTDKMVEESGLAQKQFALAQFDQLYREKKPVWCAERLLPEQIKLAKEKIELAKIYFYRLGPKELITGNLEGCYQAFWNGLKHRAESTEIRDKSIAANLATAEERIRARYPELRDKKELHYCFDIGALHFPERYTHLPITVVDMSDQESISGKMDFAYAKGLTLDEMKPLILAQALKSFRSILQVTEMQLAQMSPRELLSLARKVSLSNC